MFFVNAFKTVTDLVQDFKENENYFLKHSYSEADIRNDFIKNLAKCKTERTVP